MRKRTPLTFTPEKSGTPVRTAPSPPIDDTATPPAARSKGRAGRQFLAAHVVPDAAKQLKLLGVHQGRTTQALLIEAINDLFAKYGLSRIADD